MATLWEQRTRWFLLCWVVLAVVYDFFALHYGGPSATISKVTAKFCSENPIVAFAFGVIVGHLLW